MMRFRICSSIRSLRRVVPRVALALLLFFGLHPSGVEAGVAVTSIACGSDHSLFSKADGSLWTMGYNQVGQLGIGFSPIQTNVPQQVLTSGVGTVAAGDFHSLFRMGGSLWAMGDNLEGQLGDGTSNNFR